jgi:hypothetical protein
LQASMGVLERSGKLKNDLGSTYLIICRIWTFLFVFSDAIRRGGETERGQPQVTLDQLQEILNCLPL